MKNTPSQNELSGWYRTMCAIRFFEEHVIAS